MMKQSYALGSAPSGTATGHKTTMGRLLLMTLTLLLAMFAPSAMYAQQALPYTYGFEDNDLTVDGWVLQGATSGYTGINSDAKRSDSYGFRFSYAEQSAYLLSPILTGTETGVEVSFWYKEYSDSYGDEQFQVGYTTDESVTDASEFTYGEVVTASTDWQEYLYDFPAGTKRIAVKYIYNDCWYLFLDDFSFTVPASCPKPTNLVASEITAKTAVLSWIEKGTATSWEICLNGDEANLITADSNPFTLTGLTPETDYIAKVRAVNGSDKSNWSNEISFTTDVEFPAPTALSAGNITATSAEISWTTNANATSDVLEYAEGNVDVGTWYYYDNGTNYSAVGLGGSPFSWGVMFPAGSYSGNGLKKVSIYDYAEFTGSVTIYNDGTASPSNEIATLPVNLTGSRTFVEFRFNNLVIDDTKNVWVVFHFESGETYSAATCQDDSGDPNGRWVEINGSWYDLAKAGVTNQAFMIRADIGEYIDPSTLSWTTVNNATSPYAITGLTPLTGYTVRLKSIYAGGESLWAMNAFTTLDANPVPANIVADLTADGATLTWDGTGDSYNVKYRTAANTEVLFYEGFEKGLPNTWTTIDADGDGYNWTAGPALSHSGNQAAYSESYVNGTGALTPDNWLITPQLDLQGTMSVWLRGQDPQWVAEHFAIYLSTTGKDIADFTTELVSESVATDKYVEYTADLSAYAGQKGYIAIRHFKTTDMFWLNIDDFTLYGATTAGSAWQSLAVTDATATLSGLATNNGYEYQIQSVKGGETSEWSPSGEFALLTLQDATPNTSLILNNIGKQAHITLSNRTLYKNDAWNSLCLPFDVSDLTGTPLESAIVKELDTTGDYSGNTTGVNGSTLNLYFKDATSIEAGKPYFVKWASGENIVAPAFSNVIINSTSPTAVNSTDDNVTFVGNYDPISIAGEDKSILFLTTGNKLDYPNAAMTFGAFRAHFELADGVSANALVLDFGNGETTSISEKKINGEGSEGAWYMLDGRKMDNKPTQHGVYINNGRKVVIK